MRSDWTNRSYVNQYFNVLIKHALFDIVMKITKVQTKPFKKLTSKLELQTWLIFELYKSDCEIY